MTIELLKNPPCESLMVTFAFSDRAAASLRATVVPGPVIAPSKRFLGPSSLGGEPLSLASCDDILFIFLLCLYAHGVSCALSLTRTGIVASPEGGFLFLLPHERQSLDPSLFPPQQLLQTSRSCFSGGTR